MKTYMEYDEFEIPDEVQGKMEKLAEMGSAAPETRPTLKNAGFFEWANKMAREGGWRVVWQGFNFPFIVMEREVTLEEVKN